MEDVVRTEGSEPPSERYALRLLWTRCVVYGNFCRHPRGREDTVSSLFSVPFFGMGIGKVGPPPLGLGDPPSRTWQRFRGLIGWGHRQVGFSSTVCGERGGIPLTPHTEG